MQRYILILLLMMAGSGLYFYKASQAYPDITNVRFSLIDGRHLDMKQLQGKPVFVTFWATTCASCIKEIPELIHLYETYAPKGLEIIAVAMPYDRPDHVLEMVKKRKLPYPVALDIDTKIVQAFDNVRITPNHFFVAPNGRIIRHQMGVLDLAETEQWLQSLLTTGRD